MRAEAHESDLDNLARASKRSRRLPSDAACSRCSTRDHLTKGADGEILCYGCGRVAEGSAAFEHDHIAGRHNIGGLTVALRANDHRTATEFRRALGMDQWPPSKGDPLLAAGHSFGGLATVLWLLAKWFIDFGIWLQGRLGPNYWKDGPPSPVMA